MSKISYLHLSDLHIGDKHQRGLISRTKKVLFEDISFIINKLEALDVVFFTGDFVQKGSEDEFTLVEEFLKELWCIFQSHGHNPYLLCVPGNHDLERFHDQSDPTQKVLANWINEDIKEEYFWNGPNCYIDFLNKRFENYLNWYKKTSIRKPDNLNWGYLPGDFYTSFEINNTKLGVVGLNSTFLQLDGRDATKKLGIYIKQIDYLFKGKYTEWLDEHNISILLTHHSPDWFEPKALEEYGQEIYCSNSYLENLCGHMHEPLYITSSINGFPSKRYFITPSLFGIEMYKDKASRIHGYTAGIYNIQPSGIEKTIWPRKSIITSNGIKIAQNEEFNLDKDSASFKETLSNSNSLSSEKDEEETISVKEMETKSGNLFAKRNFLDNCLARTLYKESLAHMKIRLHEQNKAINDLIECRYCWISTKFGLSEDEFIGSILTRSNINPANCIAMNCDEIFSVKELIDSFPKIFSLNITKFFDIVNTLDRPLLILNKINDKIIHEASNLKEFINTIFDFSPQLKVIIISDTIPDSRFFRYVELYSLDIPAVKQYIENSQEIYSTFTFLEYEKIHRITSGIPFYIDKIIEQLMFRPLSDMGDLEFSFSSEDADNFLPISIKNEIIQLHTNNEKEASRRFLLLAAISLLHNGETFERIKRFDSTKPFHPEDISYLLKNKLIETIQVNSIFDSKQKDSDIIKIIKVPRTVRDYTSSLLTNNEKVEIYKMACDLYLGANWRNHIKLVQSKDVELDLIIYQNLQIAIRYILSNGVEQNNEIEITRMTQVAMSLVDFFAERGAYKDAVSLTEEVLLLIKNVDFDGFYDTRTYLTKSLGENLRMTSFHDKSISILESICNDENNALSKHDRNDIRLSIAYAYLSKKEYQEAIKYADLIKKNESKKNSNMYLSAEFVIISSLLEKDEKISRLNSLKAKAEKYNTLKANITLSICRLSKDSSQIKNLDKIILESKNDTYNKVRALVLKADILLKTKKIEDITSSDLLGLNISYSYAFYQRLQSLLNQSHRLAWRYWEEQNEYEQLLNLFRYSSFVWRLCGDKEEEQGYIDELYSNPQFLDWFNLNKTNVNGTYLEQRFTTLYNRTKMKELT